MQNKSNTYQVSHVKIISQKYTQRTGRYPFREHKHGIGELEWNKTIWLQLSQLQMAIHEKNATVIRSKPTQTTIHFINILPWGFVSLILCKSSSKLAVQNEFLFSTLSTLQHDTRAAFLFSQRLERKNPNYTKQK